MRISMKKRILYLFLCSMMLSGVVCDCGSKNNNTGDTSASTEEGLYLKR